jgi:HEAT repeat protein
MRTLALLGLFATAALAQRPEIENARLETRAFSRSLASQLSQLGAGPFWAGYSEPIVAGRQGDMCWNDGNGEGGHAANAPVRLEGPVALVVLVRVENSAAGKLRITSPDCRLDAGGLPFYWIENVPAAESVAWLKAQAEQTGARNDSAIFAIALHKDAAADRALDELSAPPTPEPLREKTAFWLGQTRGANGVARLRAMLSTDPSTRVRERAVFALSQSRDPEGLRTVIDEARNDKDPHVRGQALFWLAQKAGNRETTRTISSAVANDPDRSVKERAVFALQQLPNGEGVPMLIEVAKSNPDPQVRKKAMFWLGQSKDPRAVEFFAQVLK